MKRWMLSLPLAALAVALVVGAIWLWPSDAQPVEDATVSTLTTTTTTESSTTTTTTTTATSATSTTSTTASTTVEMDASPTNDAVSSSSSTTTTTIPTTTTTTGPPKLIALTFDDGPGEYTERLLDILKQDRVPATFFVLGRCAVSRPETVLRMVKERHEVGGHSYTHTYLPGLSDAKLDFEMGDTAKAVEEITGKPMTLFRAPYGALSDKVKAKAKELDMRLIGWSVDTRDWEYKNVDVSYARAQILFNTFTGWGKIEESGIILMHDIHENSVESVHLLVDYLRQNGYEFVTVSELLALYADGGEAGSVYQEFVKNKK